MVAIRVKKLATPACPPNQRKGKSQAAKEDHPEKVRGHAEERIRWHGRESSAGARATAGAEQSALPRRSVAEVLLACLLSRARAA